MNDMNEELPRLLNEADRLVDRSEFRKAIDICRYILLRYQDDMIATEKAHVHGCLGELLLMTGCRTEGRMHVETALRLDPDGHRWHYLIGFLYCDEQKWYEAREELRKALDGNPHHKSYLSVLGNSEIACGNIEEGLSYLYRALELSKLHGKGSVLTRLSTVQLLLGDIGEAKRYALEAVEDYPGNIMAWALLRRIEEFKRHPEWMESKYTIN